MNDEKTKAQVEEAEKLMEQVMKLYGLSDKGVLMAITYARGVRDGETIQKAGA